MLKYVRETKAFWASRILFESTRTYVPNEARATKNGVAVNKNF